MATITTTTHKILDSAGNLANGTIYFTQTSRFVTADALVTTAQGKALVKDGELARALVIPETPADEFVKVVEVFGPDPSTRIPVTWWTSVGALGSYEYTDLPVEVAPDGTPGPSFGGGGTVYFGSDENTVRPVSSQPIIWVGNTGVTPVNAVENDLIFTADPVGDVTPPTAGTLGASAITDDGFTLTVTGAADETALHATPYGFSTNNGVSWSAYQSSAVFVASGLDPDTGYTVQHRVRDAAGNVSTGTTQLVTTTGGGSSPFLQSATDGTDGTVYTFSAQPIGDAYAGRRVVVAIGWAAGGARTLTSVTIGGVAASVDADPGAIGGNRRIYLVSAVVPTGTTADIVVTVSSTITRIGIGAWRLDDMAPTGQTDAVLSASSGSLTVTTTTGEVVICFGFASNGVTETPAETTWTDATERYDEQVELVSNTHTGADVVAAGASTVVGFNTTATGERGFAAAAYGA